jgi:hypothetical protein
MANAVVFGIFLTKEQVETAVGAMKEAGFRNIDIAVFFSYSEGTKDFGLETGLEAGMTSTVVIEGELGSLNDIGLLTNPGLGPFIAAGPIMALLNDTDSVIGGLTGALTRIGIPEELAPLYAKRLKEGSILFSVHADDFKWIRKARNLIEVLGAEDAVLTGETIDVIDDD